MKVKLKRFDYVLDWFESKEVEIDTDDFCYFVMEYRCGDWYLLHFIVDNNRVKNDYFHDFQLSCPADAVVKLGDKIKGYRSLHGKSVTGPLSELLSNAESLLEAA